MRILWSSFSVLLIYRDTKVLVRNCILDDDFLRSSNVRLAEVVVDVDTGYYRRTDFERACSLARRKDSRRPSTAAHGTVPLNTCLCLSGSNSEEQQLLTGNNDVNTVVRNDGKMGGAGGVGVGVGAANDSERPRLLRWDHTFFNRDGGKAFEVVKSGLEYPVPHGANFGYVAKEDGAKEDPMPFSRCQGGRGSLWICCC